MTKNKLMVLSCILALVFFLGAVSLAAAEADPKVGQVVGAVKFAKPMSDDDAKTLGLSKAEEFTLKDVKSPYVFVEQFNTGCPHCVRQAPLVNALYNMVQQNAGLSAKLKFMAVGQGNSEMDMKAWKAIQKVAFPLIPDPNSSFGKALNFSPYPVSMVIDKSGKILWVHIGEIESAEEALKGITAVVK
jgi:thiol-disulfide isomerase/thioredoxin